MRNLSLTLLLLGFTAILVGYLSVWLHGPGAGLSFLGVEMGEWFKFLGLGSRRDFFYVPPITLGLMLAIWPATWPPRGPEAGFDWRAWSVRALAILVSLLAFPAIEDITGPVREQYTLRVILIVLVIVVALVTAFWHPKGMWRSISWLAMMILSILGAGLPLWMFMQVKSFLSDILGSPVSAGIGLVLTIGGNALVLIAALYQVVAISRTVD